MMESHHQEEARTVNDDRLFRVRPTLTRSHGMLTVVESIAHAANLNPIVAGDGVAELKGCSASCKAAYVAGRSARSFARQLRTMVARPRGTRGTRVRGDGGASAAIRATSASRFVSSKGGWPVSR